MSLSYKYKKIDNFGNISSFGTNNLKNHLLICNEKSKNITNKFITKKNFKFKDNQKNEIYEKIIYFLSSSNSSLKLVENYDFINLLNYFLNFNSTYKTNLKSTNLIINRKLIRDKIIEQSKKF